MLVGAGGTFNEALHPRAQGGKFGQANNPQKQAQGRDAALKDQLMSRAQQFRQEAHRIGLQIAEKRAQVASLKSSGTSHKTSLAKRSTGKTAKGSKSGLAKKQKTAPAKPGKPASIKSTKATTARTNAAKQVTAKEIGKLSYQIHGLQVQRDQFLSRATELVTRARSL